MKLRLSNLFSVFFLVLTISIAHAQRNPLDTLMPKLAKAKGKEKSSLYNKIGKEYSKQSQDSAIKYFRLALEISQKENIPYEEGLANHNLGLAYYVKKEYDEALKFYEQAIKTREKIKDIEGLGKTYNNIGIIKFETGKYDEAIESYQRAFLYKEELKDSIGMANTMNNIANVYIQKAQNENAILYLQKALKIFEKLKNKEGMYKCLNGIGVTYSNIGIDKYPLALQFQQEALKIAEELNNPVLMAQSYNNIGNIQYSLEADSIRQGLLNVPLKQRYARTLANYKKSLAMRQQVGDKREIAISLGNIGIIYNERQEYTKSIEYYNQALAINMELNNPYEAAVNLKALGRINLTLGNYQKALEYLHKALDIAVHIQAKSLENSCCKSLSEVYERMNDYRLAYKYNKRYAELQDTLWSLQSNKSLAEMQTKYDTEKMQHAKELAEKEAENQRKIIYLGAVILLIILTALVIVFRLYGQIRQKNIILNEQKAEIEAQRDEIQKQRDIAEKQRDLIAEQKKEITDSIYYAQRIQRAILPKDEEILAHLPDHFILFRPRDIVSGDFYWFAYHQERIVIAAADCTGHGVPGAFMSMLGVSLLNEIVKNSSDIPQANVIVTKLREMIISTLSQSATSETSTKDGMDIALCVIDRKAMRLEYAGAHNPLYMIRNGTLTEYDADHMPVGVYQVMDPFKNNIIDIQQGDAFYIFSDGYCDQFGGPQGKKFKSKPFKELLQSIQDKPMKEQGEIVEKVRLDWLGTEYSQIDDVCVIGFRI